jgi:hypothetical protein
MRMINEFVQEHHWACKSPIHCVYSGDLHEGGRLHTAFQNLPSRHYKIRINTEIDGEPICEVDFNANHLRLLLALNERDVIGGEDAYGPLVEEAGVSRAKVKSFITIALNCKTFEEAMRAAKSVDKEIVADDCRRITETFEKLYPNVSLFYRDINYGGMAQNIEGEIMKHVMLTGMKDNVIALPIHDAIAVRQRHSDWAQGAMTAAWEYSARHWDPKAKASVKVNWPTNS